MARCLFSTLTANLRNHLLGKFHNSLEKSQSFLNTVHQQNLYSSAFYSSFNSFYNKYSCSQLLSKTNTFLKVKSSPTIEPVRTVIKFSLKDGKRETEKGVVDRFFRLHWGAWIRCRPGRRRKLWKKSSQRKHSLQNHVFCTTRQCRMLDKMVSKYWRRPKYYIEDPYAPYHTRENFVVTRKKPWRPEGVDYE